LRKLNSLTVMLLRDSSGPCMACETPYLAVGEDASNTQSSSSPSARRSHHEFFSADYLSGSTGSRSVSEFDWASRNSTEDDFASEDSKEQRKIPKPSKLRLTPQKVLSSVLNPPQNSSLDEQLSSRQSGIRDSSGEWPEGVDWVDSIRGKLNKIEAVLQRLNLETTEDLDRVKDKFSQFASSVRPNTKQQVKTTQKPGKTAKHTCRKKALLGQTRVNRVSLSEAEFNQILGELRTLQARVAVLDHQAKSSLSLSLSLPSSTSHSHRKAGTSRKKSSHTQKTHRKKSNKKSNKKSKRKKSHPQKKSNTHKKKSITSKSFTRSKVRKNSTKKNLPNRHASDVTFDLSDFDINDDCGISADEWDDDVSRYLDQVRNAGSRDRIIPRIHNPWPAWPSRLLNTGASRSKALHFSTDDKHYSIDRLLEISDTSLFNRLYVDQHKPVSYHLPTEHEEEWDALTSHHTSNLNMSSTSSLQQSQALSTLAIE